MQNLQFRGLEVKEVRISRGKLENFTVLVLYPPNKRQRHRFLVSVFESTEWVGNTAIQSGSIVSGHGTIIDVDKTAPISKITVVCSMISVS